MGNLKFDADILSDKWLMSLTPAQRWTWIALLAEVDEHPTNGDYLVDLGYQKMEYLAEKIGSTAPLLEKVLNAALEGKRAFRDKQYPFVIRVRQDNAVVA